MFIEGALQTRKWQGQDGQDRYSTEVVLQGFNGNLTMLDGRSGGGMSEGGQADYGGGDNGYSDAPRAAARSRRRRCQERRQLRQAARRRDPVLTSHANFSSDPVTVPELRLRDFFVGAARLWRGRGAAESGEQPIDRHPRLCSGHDGAGWAMRNRPLQRRRRST